METKRTSTKRPRSSSPSGGKYLQRRKIIAGKTGYRLNYRLNSRHTLCDAFFPFLPTSLLLAENQPSSGSKKKKGSKKKDKKNRNKNRSLSYDAASSNTPNTTATSQQYDVTTSNSYDKQIKSHHHHKEYVRNLSCLQLLPKRESGTIHCVTFVLTLTNFVLPYY
jgi:hypothetical protein